MLELGSPPRKVLGAGSLAAVPLCRAASNQSTHGLGSRASHTQYRCLVEEPLQILSIAYNAELDIVHRLLSPMQDCPPILGIQCAPVRCKRHM